MRARNPDIKRRLVDMVEDVQSIVAEIRTAIFDLHGGVHGTGQLRKRLNEITGDTGLRTTVRMSGPIGGAGPDLADHAEAVLREALANAIRHARAGSLVVTVSAGDELVIDVTDDGVGIPDTVARSGLHNLTERAHQAGGTCTATRTDEGGTRFTWSAPMG